MEFGKVKMHKYPLPKLIVNFKSFGFIKLNQWCLAYKEFKIGFFHVMYFSPISEAKSNNNLTK